MIGPHLASPAWSPVRRNLRFPLALVERPYAAASDAGTAVAVYADHASAEHAVKALQRGGFDMTKLSIVGADYHRVEDVVGYYNTGDRMRAWGRNGAFWGGMWGLFFGFAIFAIPGIGPVVAAGPLVASIVSILEGAVVVGGLSALGAGLAGLGIPHDSIVAYEMHVKAGRYVVVARGSHADAARASDILTSAGIDAPELHLAVVA